LIQSDKILINGVNLFSLREYDDSKTYNILIQNGIIQKIDPSIKDEEATHYNANGLLAMPGFIQTHIHLCQTLFRNSANDLELLDWLEKRIWPLEAAHDSKSMAISARLGILELIKSGTTTILDMGSTSHTESILNEIESSGMRASIGITFMDSGKNVPKKLLISPEKSINHFNKLYKKWHNSNSSRIQLNLAPRFALSCSENLLRQITDISKQRNLLIHTHASENKKEVAFIREKYGLGNVSFYHKLGMTGKNLCLAHCIWIDENEIEIINETESRILHCPSSNLKLGSGIANIPYYLEKGIICSLGADGAPCNNNLNMFTEMRLAGLIQKPRHGPKSMPAKTLLGMTTINGAKTIQQQDQIGTLEVGKKADIILVDLHSAHTCPNTNLFAQLVYATQSENVHSVFIDGTPIMWNREVLTIDETETVNFANEEYHKILNRANL